MARNEYVEIAKGELTKNRLAIISSYSKGGYTIAQQLKASDNNEVINIFMKGAIHVDTIEGLYNLRDAINIAIEKIESGKLEDKISWDN